MENETFHYTYCAKEQEEIKAIRKKYDNAPEPEDKLEKLRRLDNRATQKATMTGLVVGIVGALIMGFGMSLIMTDLGRIFDESWLTMAVGIAVGLVGGLLAFLAYPLYNRVLKKERERIAPEIIRLTDELMQ